MKKFHQPVALSHGILAAMAITAAATTTIATPAAAQIGGRGGGLGSPRTKFDRTPSQPPQSPRPSQPSQPSVGGNFGRSDTRNDNRPSVGLPSSLGRPGVSPSRPNFPTISPQSPQSPSFGTLPPKPVPGLGANGSRPSVPNGLPYGRPNDEERKRDRDRDRNWDRYDNRYYNGYNGYNNYNYRFGPGPFDNVYSPYGGTTIFTGYSTIFVPNRTVVSPYTLYGIPSYPPYIGTTSVITTPWPYLNGRELAPFQPFSDSDRYYSSDAARGRALRATLNDLARFWEENDTRALRNRVSDDLTIAVFQDDHYAYSLKRGDFLALSNDALAGVSTESFRFDTVRERSDGLVNAYATHTYRVRGENGGRARAATVRYTLAYIDGEWCVSAIYLSSDLARATATGR